MSMELLIQKCSLLFAMNRCRHQRLRVRLSILAIVALLWSQFVLASHPATSMSFVASVEANATALMEDGCRQPAPSDDATLCTAHCSQGDQSSEVGRVPPVPALAPAPAIWVSSIVTLDADRVGYVALPPPVSWHRPTSHPASLLLI